MSSNKEENTAEPAAAENDVGVEEVNTEEAGFDSFGFNESLLKGIQAAGFRTPSPIQAKAIPAIMSGKDIIGQAHTGTGKTAAFALPALNQLDLNAGVQLLVVAPTRELATQVSDEIYRLGKFTGIRTGTVLGGQDYRRQIAMFQRGIHALAATPGRMLDLLKGGKIKNFCPTVVVLDEADEMLDMGFLDDIKAIFEFLPEKRQTLLFSATMPKPIRKLAEKILDEPLWLKTIDESESTNTDIHQLYYVIEERERENAVMRLIDDQLPEKAIVFCRTRMEVDRLGNILGARGYNAKSLHGDMEQPQRNRVMSGFREGLVDILVATDVAARGLDVADVTHVFNYHLPFDTKSYIHRVGRTGRAGNKGTAITLVTPREFHQLERIRRNVGANIENRLIPDLRQLRANRRLRFQKQVSDCTITPEAFAVVRDLEEEMDLTQMACKLAAMLLNEDVDDGPDKIGLTGDRLDRVLTQKRGGPKGGSPKGGGGRRPFRGGYHKGGQGGKNHRKGNHPGNFPKKRREN